MTQNRFLIVDDSRTIRTHLKQLVRQIAGEVIGEAANGEEAIKLYDDLRPDIVLLDVNMPKLDGRGVLLSIMTRWPDAVVIMLTSQDTMEIIEECLSIGAMNYILKSNSDDVIVAELKSTMEQVVTAQAKA